MGVQCIRLSGFSFFGIEIAIGIEIDSLVSVGHFSSIPIGIPISIWDLAFEARHNELFAIGYSFFFDDSSFRRAPE